MKKNLLLFLISSTFLLPLVAQKPGASPAPSPGERSGLHETLASGLPQHDGPSLGAGVKKLGTCAENPVSLGSSDNAFSSFYTRTNQLAYSPELHALAFAHRQNAGEPGGSGIISYDYSLDGGSNWDHTNKPLTPTFDLDGDGTNIGLGNRHPNGTIYNPPGNTNPANAFFVSVGPAIHQTFGTGSWGYEFVASSPLAYSGNDVSEKYYTNADYDLFNPTSLVAKPNDGSLWYVNTRWDAATDPTGQGDASFSEFLVTKLTFNSSTKSFDRSVVAALQADYAGVPASIFKGDFQLAFSPDGQTGYVVMLATDAGHPQLMAAPIIWVTTDGGNNWVKDLSIDYTLMPELLLHTANIDGEPSPDNDLNKRPYMLNYDLTVDFKGDLHLFADMYAGSSFHPDSLNWGYFNSNGAANLFHFTYHLATANWETSFVAPWQNSPGYLGNSQLRPFSQASRTPDGSKLFFTWSMTDPDMFSLNEFPDVYGVAFDPVNEASTPPINLCQAAGAAIMGGAFLPTLAPVSFAQGEGCGDFDYELPHVTLFPTNTDANPVDFFFTPGMGFNDTDFPANNFPAADFAYSGFQLDITFTDLSDGNPVNWLWDFGDGETSTEQFPLHYFPQPDEYTVCLTVTNAIGNSNTACQQVIVSSAPYPIFSIAQSELHFSFTDASLHFPNAWMWDFGDNSPASFEQNPEHTYATPGVYEVCLTASNNLGTNLPACTFVYAYYAPVADFSFQNIGTSFLDLQFTDLSSNQPFVWAWDFGDGGTSTEQHPTHTFANFTTYEVCLTVTNSGGQDQICQTVNLNPESTDEPGAYGRFSVAPNPAAGRVALRSTSGQPLPAGASLLVFHATGQGLRVPSWPTANGFELDLTGLPQGSYWFRVIGSDGNTLASGRIAKQ